MNGIARRNAYQRSEVFVLHAFALIAATAALDSCSAFHARAAALGPVHVGGSTDGAEQYSASKAWQRGHLTYASTQTATKAPPSCSDGTVTYDGPGFSFWRDPPSVFTKSFDQSGNIRQGWFQGKTYGYTILAGSKTLTVLSLPEFTDDLNRATHAQSSIE